MTKDTGRHYTAIPGPSVVPDRVLQAMHRAAPNIYDAAIKELIASLVPDLKQIAGTSHDAALYIANGHGVWEAALANTISAGDEVLILATGRFAMGWAEMADRLGAQAHIMDFGNQTPFDVARVAQHLDTDKDHKIRAILAVHVDTATSVKSDIDALRSLLDEIGHPALLMVDCIASFGCDRFEMDAWGADVVVAACQKGLMTPPGIGFVFFNDKADEWRSTTERTSHYWDWRPRANPEIVGNYFDGTSPTHLVFALREALNMIQEEGIENVWQRHERNARAYWAAIECWGQDGAMRLNVADPANRSHAVTTIRIGAPDGTRLREWVADQAGVTLGVGLGMAEPDDPAWHGFFRIGHMGHVNGHMVLGVAGVIEAALIALDIPHRSGGGVAAARAYARF